MRSQEPRFIIGLKQLAEAISPPKPVSLPTLHRWLKILNAGEVEDRAIAVTLEEVAVLTAYAWLKHGTPIVTPQINELCKEALETLNAGKDPVLILVKLTKTGAKGRVATTRPKDNDRVFAFDLSWYRTQCLGTVKEMEKARSAGA